MAKVLRSVFETSIPTVIKYWRVFLAGLEELHPRLEIAAGVARAQWLVNDAWIQTVQPTLAHEAQPTLLAINKDHQATGVQLAQAEATLAATSDTPGDISAVWAAAMVLAFMPFPVVAQLATHQNQLRWLTEVPDVSIQLDSGQVIPLGQFATAAGSLAWYDTQIQNVGAGVEITGAALSSAAAAAGEVLSAAVEVVKAAAKAAGGLAGAWPLILGGYVLYKVKK